VILPAIFAGQMSTGEYQAGIPKVEATLKKGDVAFCDVEDYLH
jgi:hypothetical protein